MALSNLAQWSSKETKITSSACGTACGSGDKPQATACGTACGAGDKK